MTETDLIDAMQILVDMRALLKKGSRGYQVLLSADRSLMIQWRKVTN